MMDPRNRYCKPEVDGALDEARAEYQSLLRLIQAKTDALLDTVWSADEDYQRLTELRMLQVQAVTTAKCWPGVTVR